MASEYKLNLKVSKEDLEIINDAGKRVVLVKENGEGSFSSGSEFIEDMKKQSGAVIENKKVKNKNQEE